jgi:hypothetical protein
MTKDEILALPAGPELDKLIAEKVMRLTWNGTGWSPFTPALGGARCVQDVIIEEKLPAYSTAIVEALAVVETLHAAGLGAHLYCHHLFGLAPNEEPLMWGASFSIYEGFDRVTGHWGVLRETFNADAESLPLAICRAALLAVTEPTDG